MVAGAVRVMVSASRGALATALPPGKHTHGQGSPLIPFRVVDDAITAPLKDRPGDATRGRAVALNLSTGALNRSTGNCVTGDELPLQADFQGTLGPPLAGVGERCQPGDLRLRIVDGKRINPDSNMPSYHRMSNLNAVRADWVGRPILTPQEVEDVLAHLMTLR